MRLSIDWIKKRLWINKINNDRDSYNHWPFIRYDCRSTNNKIKSNNYLMKWKRQWSRFHDYKQLIFFIKAIITIVSTIIEKNFLTSILIANANIIKFIKLKYLQ